MSDRRNSEEASIRLLVFAIFGSVAIYLFAVFHPFSRPVYLMAPLPLAAVHAWLVFQAFGLCLPGLLLGVAMVQWFPRTGTWLGGILVALGCSIFFLDVLTFNFIRERFLSETSRRILIDLAPGLLANLNQQMIISAASVLTACLAGLTVAGFTAKWLASRILQDSRQSSPWHSIAVGLAILFSAAAMPLSKMHATFDWMRENSDRQPLFATGLVQHLNQGVSAPLGRDRLRSATRALSMVPSIREMRDRYSMLDVKQSPDHPPDILLVVIESLRPEAINPRTAPNLYGCAQRGLWCQQHYSTGNSTNLGMFSMLFGLESVWFERAVAWEPALLKLAKSAGYETGFFGGSDGWDLFQMDPFINPDRFDRYHDSAVNWLVSDAEMCRLAEQFLDAPDGEANAKTVSRQPRLCVLYLYSTHFDYRSDPQDRVHGPSLEGELTGGYSDSDRDRIWNRYLNSVHSMDRLLEPLLNKDRIVVVAGDHGEAFLEDGCRLHGVQISRYQNATPAIITASGIPARKIDYVTSHTDLLPTILDAANIELSDPDVMEGRSLLTLQGSDKRLMVTRNYVRPEMTILHDQRDHPKDLLGHRCFFSMLHWEAYAANPIDDRGVAWQGENQSADAAQQLTESVFSEWLQQRFGDKAATVPERTAEALTPYLKSSDVEVRVFALGLAAAVDNEEIRSTLPLVVDASQHHNERVREAAQSTLIILQRRLK
ncbi:MAG: sulfatase-like hydrolase/transferase [Planctomycetaceae bacterium]